MNEVFFIALYLLSFSSPLLSPHLVQTVEAKSGESMQPGHPVDTSILKQIFPDPFSAAALELARANKMDSTVPWVIASVCLPVMAAKQFINVVQLVRASNLLADTDRKMRRAQGLPRKPSKKA
jgi:CDP-diacylglycerol--inositol 3-phosphatidyltransferase